MLRIRVRFRHPIPRLLGVGAIVLYPYVLFASDREKVSSRTVQHEFVHVRQVREVGFFGFYFRYLLEYLLNLVKYRNHFKAYELISFEAEAYATENSVKLTSLELEEYAEASPQNS